MKFNVYNLIWLGLNFLSLGIHLGLHGERRKDNYNIFTALISFGIEIFLLVKGGFFG